MNDSDTIRDLLASSAEQLFGDLCDRDLVNSAEEDVWPEVLWSQLSDLGFTRALLPEEQGGSALALADLLPVLRLAGRHAVPLPLGETVIAGWLLAGAGLAVPEGPLAFGPVDRGHSLTLSRVDGAWQLNGRLRRIPWGERAARIALVLDTAEGPRVVAVDPALASARSAGTNLAGESRLTQDFHQAPIAPADLAPAAPGSDSVMPYLLGALIRGQQMAGALSRCRDLAVRYSGERIAFGKPLNRLPAVQHNLALLAGQAAAAEVAAELVGDALADRDADLELALALARVRINEAAEIGARLAHQVHGAIGFTYEHRLHQLTRRLWAWRDEFGHDAWWAARAGERLIAAGGDQFWPLMTRVARL
ncbi:MAG TPA: acyl-CoA dehydrogenase family protein [Porticoccaceae bacterium]|nr:acyl-CoA dehydrogenase family protein [Porticoccaceae bacterium]